MKRLHGWRLLPCYRIHGNFLCQKTCSKRPLGARDSQTFRLVFSPDGTLLCAGRCDGSILIWSTVSGSLLDTINTGSNSVRFLAFTRNNDYLLSLDDEGSLQCWNIPGSTNVWSHNAKKESRVCIGMTPWGEVAFISEISGKIQGTPMRKWTKRA